MVPLGFKLINTYLDAGFKLRELVIKRQHNCKTTGFWHASSIKYNFLLLAHEYLPIFEKPEAPLLSGVKEVEMAYDLVAPRLGKPPLKRKLDELETTTVWVLPEKDFEKRLNKNVIDRYSSGDGYSTIDFSSYSENETSFSMGREKKKGLLFVRSPFLSNNPSESTNELYLQKVKETVGQNVTKITEGGFIVIQTQDVRIDGYIEPLAKRLVDVLALDNLWLKEIIVVTQEKANSNTRNSGNCLGIAHQYLLVYEVRK